MAAGACSNSGNITGTPDHCLTVVVNPSARTMSVGDTLRLTGTAIVQNSSGDCVASPGQVMQWTNDASSVLTIEENGHSSASVLVHATQAGTAHVNAVWTETGAHGFATITVQPPST
jgi:hypothetical protein